ncbi:Uncharacterised protein [Bordetella pertussis]|nr:Uncharacterised protein [Bordetella pertussis]
MARLPAGTPLAWAGLAAGKASPAFGGAYAIDRVDGAPGFTSFVCVRPGKE